MMISRKLLLFTIFHKLLFAQLIHFGILLSYYYYIQNVNFNVSLFPSNSAEFNWLLIFPSILTVVFVFPKRTKRLYQNFTFYRLFSLISFFIGIFLIFLPNIFLKQIVKSDYGTFVRINSFHDIRNNPNSQYFILNTNKEFKNYQNQYTAREYTKTDGGPRGASVRYTYIDVYASKYNSNEQDDGVIFSKQYQRKYNYRNSAVERDTIRSIYTRTSKQNFRELELHKNDTVTLVKNLTFFTSHFPFLTASEQEKMIFIEKVNDLTQESKGNQFTYLFMILSFSLLSLFFLNR